MVNSNSLRTLAGSAVLLAALLEPGLASAQIPSYAQPGGEESIHGRILSCDGQFDLTVRDGRGFVDRVRLHPGTIINPTGLTLAPGMAVTIVGYASGGYLAANEIDTPYASGYAYNPAYYVPPVPVYANPYWYGNPFAYGNTYAAPYPYYPYGGNSWNVRVRFGDGFGIHYRQGYGGYGGYGDSWRVRVGEGFHGGRHGHEHGWYRAYRHVERRRR
jgi:hypothetical protein